jgi:signal transduction histidine kinase
VSIGEAARLLAEEQAALRRMAALVARGACPSEMFEAACAEIGGLLHADGAALIRCELDGTATLLGLWNADGGYSAHGSRYDVAADPLTKLIADTRRPGRIDDYAGVPGPFAEIAHSLGWRSSVGAQIVVDGRTWGLVGACSQTVGGLPPDTEDRLSQFAQFVAAAVADTQGREEIARLAEEQASLHRVAALVASGAPPTEVFAAVAQEVARVMRLPIVAIGRYEDGDVTVVAEWSDRSHAFRTGTRWRVPTGSMTATVRATGRPARVDDLSGLPLERTKPHRASGITSTVGAPISVNGRVWGVMAAALSDSAPADLEDRLSGFTELVATAIANSAARSDLERLAEEQAALRRVATLVAEDAAPPDVFEAVCIEVGRLIAADGAALIRYEPDETMTRLGRWTVDTGYVPMWTEGPVALGPTGQVVRDTGRPSRLDLATLPGAPAAEIRALGMRSLISVPVVGGRIWGMVAVMSKSADALPADTEARVAQFTELAGTAIANAESRAELAASRARVVTTADATRRRIERDLHDGAQQQLVSLALGLRTAQAALPIELHDVHAQVGRIVDGLAGVMSELREIAQGIHPGILAQDGLASALRALGRRSPVPVELDVRTPAEMPERIEVAAYYVVAEALANAAKHSAASVVRVAVATRGRNLSIRVEDDGRGGADPALGSGLVGLRDRAEALGGVMALRSPPGVGTTVEIELPLD